MSIDTFAKSLWTDAEFDQISFHDNRVYAHAVLLEEYAFLLDIDYIVEWLHPSVGNNAYSFRVSPATLRFENIFNLKVNLELGNVFEMDTGIAMLIMAVKRGKIVPPVWKRAA